VCAPSNRCLAIHTSAGTPRVWCSSQGTEAVGSLRCSRRDVSSLGATTSRFGRSSPFRAVFLSRLVWPAPVKSPSRPRVAPALWNRQAPVSFLIGVTSALFPRSESFRRPASMPVARRRPLGHPHPDAPYCHRPTLHTRTDAGLPTLCQFGSSAARRAAPAPFFPRSLPRRRAIDRWHGVSPRTTGPAWRRSRRLALRGISFPPELFGAYR
jgi:hypothetical protein